MTDLTTARLARNEAIIEAGLATFVDVGRALMEIRDERLYRETHDTFEDYCRERWGLSRPRAYQLIEAASVTEAVSTFVDIAPANEGQARELAGLEPETAAQVLQAAAEDGPLTAQRIRDAREAITGPRPEPVPDPEPEDTGQILDDIVDGGIAEQAGRDAADRVADEIANMFSFEGTADDQRRKNLVRLVNALDHLLQLNPEIFGPVAFDSSVRMLEAFDARWPEWFARFTQARGRGLHLVKETS